MPGICAAVNATTSEAGSSRKATLKLWKSRPAAPMMSTRFLLPAFGTPCLLTSSASLPEALLQMLREPGGRERDDPIERPRLLAQMSGAAHDLQARRAGQLGHGAAGQLDDDAVVLSNDQARRRQNVSEGVGSEIRASTPGNDGRDPLRSPARCRQGRCRSRAGAEQPHGKAGRGRLLLEPVQRVLEPAGEERDIEDLAAIIGFAR